MQIKSNNAKAVIYNASRADVVDIPVKEIKLEENDLLQGEHHRKKQLAKLVVETFLNEKYVEGKDLLVYLFEKKALKPLDVWLVAGFYDKISKKKF